MTEKNREDGRAARMAGRQGVVQRDKQTNKKKRSVRLESSGTLPAGREVLTAGLTDGHVGMWTDA